MTVIASAASLLHVALQDLHAGKANQARRLPAIAEHCRDAELVALVRAEAERAAIQGERIVGAGVNIEGPRNLWMAGILDDAQRDAERDAGQTQPGRLLDVALIGAIRKAKAAEIVSSETAIFLARRVGVPELLAVATANRADEIESDRRLKARLAAVVAA